MIDEYISKKVKITGVPVTAKQKKDLNKLKSNFKAQLKQMLKDVKPKKKRNISASHKKNLSERGKVVSLLMKVKNYTLPEASHKVKQLQQKGVSYSDMLKALQ